MILLVWSQATQARGLPDFTELVEDNAGAVVNISTTSAAPERTSRFENLPFDERQLEQMPEFFQDFSVAPVLVIPMVAGPSQPSLWALDLLCPAMATC